MTLNDLLRAQGIDPQAVLVLRHRPREPQLNKVLPWLAAERHDVFNAYQQTQGEKLQKVMKGMEGMGYVASFIGREAGRATFVGLYSIESSNPLSFGEFWQVPAYIEMKSFGMKGWYEGESRRTVLWFELVLAPFYSEWKGKLIVGWPPPERSWWRRAHRNEIPVLAVSEESAFDAAMPRWQDIDWSWEELAILPTRWKNTLKEWRGIYYIFDTSDGKGYVGSAYGGDNILGRWLSYSASGHGGNRLLLARDPRRFRFTILQRVSPDMDPEEVIRLECTWKHRLHSRKPHGLNDN